MRTDLPIPDGTLWIDAGFLPTDEATAALSALLDEIPWRQEHVRMFGRQIPMPRLTCWMGDPGCDYTYSRVRYAPTPWTETAAKLRDRVTEATGEGFNAVLLNRYRSGADSMGWHADDEPELGTSPTIASVSLGAARRFDLQHRKRKAEKQRVVLTHGSLLVMAGTTQAHWKHRLPRTTTEVGERLNLTFRRITPSSARTGRG